MEAIHTSNGVPQHSHSRCWGARWRSRRSGIPLGREPSGGGKTGGGGGRGEEEVGSYVILVQQVGAEGTRRCAAMLCVVVEENVVELMICLILFGDK